MVSDDPYVLVVDDDLAVREIIGISLCDAGFPNVLLACDGTDALSLLEQHGEAIYAVLLDLRMPRLDGLSVVRHLVNVHKHVVGIVVVTGHESIESAREFLRLQSDIVLAVDYVTKPFETRTILYDVRRTIDLVRAKRLNQRSVALEEVARLHNEMQCSIAAVSTAIDSLRSEILRLARREQNDWLRQIGLEVIKTVVVGAFVLSVLYLGAGELIASVISRVR